MTTQRKAKKGPQLEELLKAYFWKAEYFAMRSVPYRIDGDDVTDIDLWLYERPGALTRRRLIVDAKRRRSPKAYERIVWVHGLRSALGVDGSIVATTDKRPSTKRLAKKLGVTLLDGNAVSKLTSSPRLFENPTITLEDLSMRIKKVDDNRRSTEFRDRFNAAQASLISGLGMKSANECLSASGFFAEQAVVANNSLDLAETALRLFYQTSALAAISIDFSLADFAFLSREKRREALISGIRFGQSEDTPVLQTVALAMELVRQYLENGKAMATILEKRFYSDANAIRAEIIAEYVANISSTDSLFVTARELSQAAYSCNALPFDGLTRNAKSLAGVILDFAGIARDKLANSIAIKN